MFFDRRDRLVGRGARGVFLPGLCVLALLACLSAGLPAHAAEGAAPLDAASAPAIAPSPPSDSDAGSRPAPRHVPNFGDQPATHGSGALYAEAVRVLSQVRATRYTGSYVVDEETGRFELNCSGFLSMLLYEVSPETLATVDRSGKHYRPRAEDFHRSILRAGPQGDGTGWLRLERVSDLHPGDVVAWLRPAERSASSATGHVMVALGRPRINPARPAEVLLPVADCTLSPHGDLAAMREAGSSGNEAPQPGDAASAAPGTSVASAAPATPGVPGMPGMSDENGPMGPAGTPGASSSVTSLATSLAPSAASGIVSSGASPVAIAPAIERGSAAWLAALPKDTRETGIGGVGSGVIGLATDEEGRPVAYWWRGGISQHQLVTSIVLGRLE